MADLIITEKANITAIADAVRHKAGVSGDMTLGDIITEINGFGSADGSTEEWIGDGNTHIWISLPKGRTSPMLGVGVNGTITVDWGDGTEPDVLTGTSISEVQRTPNHEYAAAGDYVITLSVDGEMGIIGSSAGTYLLAASSLSSDNVNYAYRNAVQKIEIGRGVTSIGNNAFHGCYSLASVVISNSVTSIGNYAFVNCYSLASVAISDSVTSIGSMAFVNCYSAAYFDFSQHTAVPTLSNANVFANTPDDCEIRVPVALVDEWKAATNWSTYAGKIVGV